MSKANTKCQTCGKLFHACSSCGMSYEWEYEYCTFKCWDDSFYRDKIIKKCEGFLEGFSIEQIKILDEILNSGKELLILEELINEKITSRNS